MAKDPTNVKTEPKSNIIGPDLFGFYKHEIVDLLNLDDNLQFSNSNSNSRKLVAANSSSPVTSFSKSLDDSIPACKKDLLKASLRQSARALTREVDEMIDPVMRIRHIIACLKSKTNRNLDGEALLTGDLTSPRKKQRTRASNGKEDLLTEQSRDAEPEIAEDDEDLKLLLGSKNSVVEEIMIKQSNEHYETLNYMELQLEEILGAVASKCRQMTHQEKQQLQKLIQQLPSSSLNRIVEIIHHGKSCDTLSLDELVVDLEVQNNATLWRLYFYTRAVENARKLAASANSVSEK
ncbi:uncharacterized protein LOC141643878 [Silene latifolia]|uniref:uncharacterized protein LOC141643878 n=1 Tax=Silene latifolia TaxID=37657 RepID=UPI003D7856CA